MNKNLGNIPFPEEGREKRKGALARAYIHAVKEEASGKVETVLSRSKKQTKVASAAIVAAAKKASLTRSRVLSREEKERYTTKYFEGGKRSLDTLRYTQEHPVDTKLENKSADKLAVLWPTLHERANEYVARHCFKMADAEDCPEDEFNLIRQAAVDPLTGLFNSRGYMVAAEQMEKMQPGDVFYMVVSDGNNFREENILGGISTGDYLIADVFGGNMHEFEDHIRSKGGRSLTMREGGEEFTSIIRSGKNGIADGVLEAEVESLRKHIQEANNASKSQGQREQYKELVEARRDIRLYDDEVGGVSFVILPVEIAKDTPLPMGVHLLKRARTYADQMLTEKTESQDGKNKVHIAEKVSTKTLQETSFHTLKGKTQQKQMERVHRKLGRSLKYSNQERIKTLITDLEFSPDSKENRAVRKKALYWIRNVTNQPIPKAIPRDHHGVLVRARMDYLSYLAESQPQNQTMSVEELNQREEKLREDQLAHVRLSFQTSNLKAVNSVLGHVYADDVVLYRTWHTKQFVEKVMREFPEYFAPGEERVEIKHSSEFTVEHLLVAARSGSDAEAVKDVEDYIKKAYVTFMKKRLRESIFLFVSGDHEKGELSLKEEIIGYCEDNGRSYDPQIGIQIEKV